MTTTIIVTISVLTFLSAFLFFRAIVLIRRIEMMEDIVIQYDERQDQTVVVLERMLQQMRDIDLRGSFESDDEVGAVFTQLKDLIEQYKQLTEDA